ncbi:MAG: hypothetical protein AB1642_00965 [Pseudomonadota bacterium]
MPNWCENRLSVSGPKETVAKIIKATKVDQGEFDFNGIVPMPPELHITSGSSTSWGEDILYGDWSRMLGFPVWRDLFFELTGGHLPETREEMIYLIENEHRLYQPSNRLSWSFNLKEARQAESNREKYGFKDWYDWSVAKWGTKWNGGEVDVESMEAEGFTIYFSTAWSPPVPVIEALCEQYPDVEAELSYAETGCWFAGKVYGSDGEISDEPADDVKQFCIEEFGHEFDDEETEEEAEA